jgi:bis(5'-nucleosyl)-tetraphosphatase (symmetrical)
VRWIVGDVQGCAREFERLLEEIRFNPAADELWSVGDLVNRGPDSVGVLRLWRSVGGRAVLGNHEVAALLAHSGARPKPMKKLRDLFRAPDADELVAALRDLPVLVHLPSAGTGPDVWVVHAGLDPRWSDLTRAAAAINAGPHDDAWLQGRDVDFATNVRCCTGGGVRNDFSGPPEECAGPFRRWDSFYSGPGLVVHGHWATRGFYRGPFTMGLDSGCVYGGTLTAWCQDEDRFVRIPASSTP